MQRKILVSVIVGLMFTLAVAGGVVAGRAQANERGTEAALGTAFTYQGRLTNDDGPVSDNCEMAFRLYDQAADGSQEGAAMTATVPITDGLFTARLDFGAGPFDGDALWLDIHVSCPGDASWTDLGRQELTAAPYALYALGAPWTGIADRPPGLDDGDDVGYDPANLIVVAKSGGDFSSVQDAIESITDASLANPYLVWVGPGTYEEKVVLTPHIHLLGAGQDATIIEAEAGSGGSASDATLVLTSNVSVRDLTVATIGDFEYNIAVMARAGVTGTELSGIAAEAYGPGNTNYAIYAHGGGTSISYDRVSATARGCLYHCSGLSNSGGARAVLRGGTFTARDSGSRSYAIYSGDTGSTIEAEGVIAVAEGGTSRNRAFSNFDGSAASLLGGFFSARGNESVGIYNWLNDAHLEATDVVVISENSSNTSYTRGLHNGSSGDAVIRGGSYTAVGGDDASGIYVEGSSTLMATAVEATGKGCFANCRGLYHVSSADALLIGGSFSGVDGKDAVGICNAGGTLEAIGVRAAGLGGSTQVGLYNESGASLLSQSQLIGADASVDIAGGSVTLTNSSLVGGAAFTGTVCLLVTRGTSVSADVAPYNCP
jgi:hypothetical protein